MVVVVVLVPAGFVVVGVFVVVQTFVVCVVGVASGLVDCGPVYLSLTATVPEVSVVVPVHSSAVVVGVGSLVAVGFERQWRQVVVVVAVLLVVSFSGLRFPVCFLF